MPPKEATTMAVGPLSQTDIEMLSIGLSKCCDTPDGPKINYKLLHEHFPRYSTSKIAGQAWVRMWRKLVTGGAAAEGTPAKGAGTPTKGAGTKRGHKALDSDDVDEETPTKKKRGGKAGKQEVAQIKDEASDEAEDQQWEGSSDKKVGDMEKGDGLCMGGVGV